MEINFLIPKEEKYKYTDDRLLINSNNVYFTNANIAKLNENIYAISCDDGSLNRTYNEIVEAIKCGDHIIINLNYTTHIVAAIIPKSLETKFKNAINNENYELAEIINNKIKLKSNL